MRKRFNLDELGVLSGRASTALDWINMSLPVAFLVWVSSAPDLALAQSTSPFMTGATALQTNILAWLTPIAIILVMVLGAMAMAARIVENCGNTLILRCAGSENGGTSQFASRLIGQREVLRTSESRSRRGLQLLSSVTRSQHLNIEPAVLDSEIEQLSDLKGYLKFASRPEWLRVALNPPAAARADEASVRVRTDATRTWGELKARDAGGPATPERGRANDGFEA